MFAWPWVIAYLRAELLFQTELRASKHREKLNEAGRFRSNERTRFMLASHWRGLYTRGGIGIKICFTIDIGFGYFDRRFF